MSLTRSEQMSRIRSSDTLPERSLRAILWHAGLRYRLHHPKLPGRPDLVFVRQRAVLFIDGCFWHGCPEHYVPPRSRTAYWSEKLALNVGRDIKRTRELEAEGWRVIRVWEHEVELAPEQAAQAIIEAVTAPTWRPAPAWRVCKVEPLDPSGERERRYLQEIRNPDSTRTEDRYRSFLKQAASRSPEPS